MPWESYLQGIESASSSPLLRKLATVYKIQARLERKDYSSVFDLTNTILQRNPGSHLWLFCQTARIFAYLGQKDTVSAERSYAAMRALGETIDRHEVRSLRRMLNAMRGIPTPPDTDSHAFVKMSSDVKQGRVPTKYSLLQNYPNPFNPATRFAYNLPENVHVTLKVYNVLGQVVSTVLDEDQDAGHKSVEFNAEQLASGIYYYRLMAGSFNEIKKMLLLK